VQVSKLLLSFGTRVKRRTFTLLAATDRIPQQWKVAVVGAPAAPFCFSENVSTAIRDHFMSFSQSGPVEGQAGCFTES
jgi:hypothetical protein